MSPFKVKILFCAFLTLNCSSDKTKESDYLVYEDTATGWTTKYPSSWTIMTEAEIDKLASGSIKMYEQISGEDGEVSGRRLLCIKKDDRNYFISGVQPIDDQTEEENDSTDREMFILLKKYGFNFDHDIQTVQIDGVPFKKIDISFYSNNREELLYHQTLYDRLKNNDEHFTFSMKYNNDADKETMGYIVNSTKF